ncbi:hypothetical protein DRQ53_13125 [bacterium]|nr:MAG: hypothetical protein DRQ53_13125 [bacterium]
MSMIRRFLLLVVIAAVCATSAVADAPVRGITLSTHGNGRDWGDDSIEPTLDRIAATGATWVAIHPYAWIANDGEVQFQDLDKNSTHLTRPIREAHQRGMKVFIKPHLGYWASKFSWRGEISFDDNTQWDLFFDSYNQWITQLAAATAEADGFCVGTELDATLAHEDAWRSVISSVRASTPAPLSYAANWSDYRHVPFWDALDVIGVQAYFPLSDKVDPDQALLRTGWRKVVSELSGFATELDRYVVFTELGYDRSHVAASRPWEARSDGDATAALQARCLRVALEVVEEEPRIIGAFLWKWFPEPHAVGRNFPLAVPAVLEVLREVWKPELDSR